MEAQAGLSMKEEYRMRTSLYAALAVLSLCFAPGKAMSQTGKDMGVSPCFSCRDTTPAPVPPPVAPPPERDLAAERRQQAEAAARTQRLGQARAANQQGLQFYKQGDWASAITAFQDAVNKNPDDAVARDNLANARTALRTQQQAKASTSRIHQSVQDLAQALADEPVASGAPVSKAGAAGLDFTTTLATPSSDPKVVDGRRGTSSDLPQALEQAVAGAYAHAPPGVSERVRKGFQAVMLRDWTLAAAWFEDALLRDPANAGLQRLIALVEAAPPRARLVVPDPGDMAIIFPGYASMKNTRHKQALDQLFGLPPAR
jgi:tetratricopeptide (TPR) repeat protein